MKYKVEENFLNVSLKDKLSTPEMVDLLFKEKEEAEEPIAFIEKVRRGVLKLLLSEQEYKRLFDMKYYY